MTIPTKSSPRRHPKTNSLVQNYLVIALGLCCCLSLLVNVYHVSRVASLHEQVTSLQMMQNFKQHQNVRGVKQQQDDDDDDDVLNVNRNTIEKEQGEEPSDKAQGHDKNDDDEYEEWKRQEDQEEEWAEERQKQHLKALEQHAKKEQVDNEKQVNVEQDDTVKQQQDDMVDTTDQQQHTLAGLNCDAWGGPSQEVAKEMVYWSDIQEDSSYASPFFSQTQPRYMTFEPDGGGWNNIRMSMETVLAMAHAMGRTLVLPPEQGMYLLGNDKSKNGNKQRKHFTFNDFFHMDSISREHEGLEIITTEEFLQREGVTGRLRNRDTNQVSFPPQNNRTNWNGSTKDINHVYAPWIRSVGRNAKWDPDHCIAAFPSSTSSKDVDVLHRIVQDIESSGGAWPTWQDYVGKPTPVNASPQERLKENSAERHKLCVYDTEMQQDLLIHFSGKQRHGGRLLVHFYAFLFFEDWKQDLWMKRFVRDHVRYVDELQCAAARVVQALREIALQHDASSKGQFDAFHVRRGDFQYKETRISAEQLYNNSRKEIPDGSTVYIATDERDKSFFDPMAKRYNLLFLDDFKHLIPSLNTNYYGMLDQLIATRSRVFFGCWFSTFSSYINRMRGYHADKEKLKGHEHGLVESYYYARPEDKYKMREFYPVKKTFHSREYPASWRGIDEGIGLLNQQQQQENDKRLVEPKQEQQGKGDNKVEEEQFDEKESENGEQEPDNEEEGPDNDDKEEETRGEDEKVEEGSDNDDEEQEAEREDDDVEEDLDGEETELLEK